MTSLSESHNDTRSPCSSSSDSSNSSSGSCKSVQFSRFIKISFTYPGDEYDRSALEPAKLTFSEASELLQLRCHWRQEMSDRIDALDGNKDLDGSDEVPNCQSGAPQQCPYNGRHHTHALLQQSASATCLHSSPPCSPVLSHHDSCSSSSSDDEYDPTLSPQHPLSLASHQQQQHRRLERFGGSRDGMMHRHSHLDQSKENVQCIA
ncbi:hypothetical protein BGZ51_000623 [Haplosporangium sp. Z 767]|nr:hypothetical protein BGZ51_000623 [Haplosporangium sp. Z 767]